MINLDRPASPRWQTLLISGQGIGLLLFFALCFVFSGGYKYGAIVLLLCGIAACFFRSPTGALAAPVILWRNVLLIFFAVMVVLRLYLGSPIKEYDELSRYLLSIFFLIGLWRFRPAMRWYLIALFFGTALALAVVVQARFLNGNHAIEDFGHQHHIQFSNLSMIMALCAGFCSFAYARFSRWWFIAIVAFLLGLLAAVFGGGRGSWLMLGPAGFCYLLANYRKLHGKTVIIASVVLIGLATSLYLIPQTKVANRIHGIFHDIQAYQEGKVATSQGMRLEMWRCGFYLISQKPLAGWGDPGLYLEKTRLTETGQFDPSIAAFAHLHNDFIDTAARYGLIGLTALLLLYFAPLVIYAHELRRRPGKDARMLAWSGIVVTLSFMVGSMTNAFLGHNISTIFFVLLQAWFITGLAQETNDN